MLVFLVAGISASRALYVVSSSPRVRIVSMLLSLDSMLEPGSLPRLSYVSIPLVSHMDELSKFCISTQPPTDHT